MWSSDYKAASRVDVEFHIIVAKVLFCQNWFNYLLDNGVLDLVIGDVIIVLMGYNNCIDALWNKVFVFNSNLAFCIRTEPFDCATLPQVSSLEQNLVCQHNRGRHKRCGLVAGKTEHKPLVAGTGSYDTAKTVELSKMAEAMGADAILAVTPQYNKPPQEGLYRHFKKVASAINVPVIAYNVPARTSVNLEPDTVKRIASLDKVIGIKEASGNLDQMSQMLRLTPPDFYVYCGDDYLALPALALGASGVISVASHIIGREMQEMVSAFERGDNAAAAELHLRNYPAYKTLFIRTSPIPVKYALNRMGVDVGPCRMPLVELDGEARARVDQLLRDLGRI